MRGDDPCDVPQHMTDHGGGVNEKQSSVRSMDVEKCNYPLVQIVSACTLGQLRRGSVREMKCGLFSP